MAGTERELRFLCAEMLRGLGRWSRAAGYDILIADGGVPDRILAERCVIEKRGLLTKDRHLAATVNGAVTVVRERGTTT